MSAVSASALRGAVARITGAGGRFGTARRVDLLVRLTGFFFADFLAWALFRAAEDVCFLRVVWDIESRGQQPLLREARLQGS